eukprot:gb/GEZN01000004.1/.p1 GENE.gb/GEZN01000004.1/~~gb/GEZN01000004.1/.p1  ORF type:complete len:5481 (-),score=821.20 gb/GEZN01000004.1/:442-16884(-)
MAALELEGVVCISRTDPSQYCRLTKVTFSEVQVKLNFLTNHGPRTSRASELRMYPSEALRPPLIRPMPDSEQLEDAFLPSTFQGCVSFPAAAFTPGLLYDFHFAESFHPVNAFRYPSDTPSVVVTAGTASSTTLPAVAIAPNSTGLGVDRPVVALPLVFSWHIGADAVVDNPPPGGSSDTTSQTKDQINQIQLVRRQYMHNKRLSLDKGQLIDLFCPELDRWLIAQVVGEVGPPRAAGLPAGLVPGAASSEHKTFRYEDWDSHEVTLPRNSPRIAPYMQHTNGVVSRQESNRLQSLFELGISEARSRSWSVMGQFSAGPLSSASLAAELSALLSFNAPSATISSTSSDVSDDFSEDDENGQLSSTNSTGISEGERLRMGLGKLRQLFNQPVSPSLSSISSSVPSSSSCLPAREALVTSLLQDTSVAAAQVRHMEKMLGGSAPWIQLHAGIKQPQAQQTHGIANSLENQRPEFVWDMVLAQLEQFKQSRQVPLFFWETLQKVAHKHGPNAIVPTSPQQSTYYSGLVDLCIEYTQRAGKVNSAEVTGAAQLDLVRTNLWRLLLGLGTPRALLQLVRLLLLLIDTSSTGISSAPSSPGGDDTDVLSQVQPEVIGESESDTVQNPAHTSSLPDAPTEASTTGAGQVQRNVLLFQGEKGKQQEQSPAGSRAPVKSPVSVSNAPSPLPLSSLPVLSSLIKQWLMQLSLDKQRFLRVSSTWHVTALRADATRALPSGPAQTSSNSSDTQPVRNSANSGIASGSKGSPSVLNFLHTVGPAEGIAVTVSLCRQFPKSLRAPRSCVDPYGFLYVLSPDSGLVKLGTGLPSTAGKIAATSVPGKLYAQNCTLCFHAGASLTFVPMAPSPKLVPDRKIKSCDLTSSQTQPMDEEEDTEVAPRTAQPKSTKAEDVTTSQVNTSKTCAAPAEGILLLRSPLLPPDQLLRIDANTLLIASPPLVYLREDGNSPVPQEDRYQFRWTYSENHQKLLKQLTPFQRKMLQPGLLLDAQSKDKRWRAAVVTAFRFSGGQPEVQLKFDGLQTGYREWVGAKVTSGTEHPARLRPFLSHVELDKRPDPGQDGALLDIDLAVRAQSNVLEDPTTKDSDDMMNAVVRQRFITDVLTSNWVFMEGSVSSNSNGGGGSSTVTASTNPTFDATSAPLAWRLFSLWPSQPFRTLLLTPRAIFLQDRTSESLTELVLVHDPVGHHQPVLPILWRDECVVPSLVAQPESVAAVSKRSGDEAKAGLWVLDPFDTTKTDPLAMETDTQDSEAAIRNIAIVVSFYQAVLPSASLPDAKLSSSVPFVPASVSVAQSFLRVAPPQPLIDPPSSFSLGPQVLLPGGLTRQRVCDRCQLSLANQSGFAAGLGKEATYLCRFCHLMGGGFTSEHSHLLATEPGEAAPLASYGTSSFARSSSGREVPHQPPLRVRIATLDMRDQTLVVVTPEGNTHFYQLPADPAKKGPRLLQTHLASMSTMRDVEALCFLSRPGSTKAAPYQEQGEVLEARLLACISDGTLQIWRPLPKLFQAPASAPEGVQQSEGNPFAPSLAPSEELPFAFVTVESWQAQTVSLVTLVLRSLVFLEGGSELYRSFGQLSQIAGLVHVLARKEQQQLSGGGTSKLPDLCSVVHALLSAVKEALGRLTLLSAGLGTAGALPIPAPPVALKQHIIYLRTILEALGGVPSITLNQTTPRRRTVQPLQFEQPAHVLGEMGVRHPELARFARRVLVGAFEFLYPSLAQRLALVELLVGPPPSIKASPRLRPLLSPVVARSDTIPAGFMPSSPPVSARAIPGPEISGDKESSLSSSAATLGRTDLTRQQTPPRSAAGGPPRKRRKKKKVGPVASRKNAMRSRSDDRDRSVSSCVLSRSPLQQQQQLRQRSPFSPANIAASPAKTPVRNTMTRDAPRDAPNDPMAGRRLFTVTSGPSSAEAEEDLRCLLAERYRAASLGMVPASCLAVDPDEVSHPGVLRALRQLQELHAPSSPPPLLLPSIVTSSPATQLPSEEKSGRWQERAGNTASTTIGTSNNPNTMDVEGTTTPTRPEVLAMAEIDSGAVQVVEGVNALLSCLHQAVVREPEKTCDMTVSSVSSSSSPSQSSSSSASPIAVAPSSSSSKLPTGARLAAYYLAVLISQLRQLGHGVSHADGNKSQGSGEAGAGGPGHSQRPPGKRFVKGQQVAALWWQRNPAEELPLVYKATIVKVNGDGTYHLQYADGDVDKAAPEAAIRGVVQDVDPCVISVGSHTNLGGGETRRAEEQTRSSEESGVRMNGQPALLLYVAASVMDMASDALYTLPSSAHSHSPSSRPPRPFLSRPALSLLFSAALLSMLGVEERRLERPALTWLLSVVLGLSAAVGTVQSNLLRLRRTSARDVVVAVSSTGVARHKASASGYVELLEEDVEDETRQEQRKQQLDEAEEREQEAEEEDEEAALSSRTAFCQDLVVLSLLLERLLRYLYTETASTLQDETTRGLLPRLLQRQNQRRKSNVASALASGLSSLHSFSSPRNDSAALQRSFLRDFTGCKVVALRGLKLSAPAAHRLSAFMAHCLNECGGGAAQHDLRLLHPAEKAAAAAVMAVHSGHPSLLDLCVEFAQSYQLRLLIQSFLERNVRCMLQRACPPWWKAFIWELYNQIRKPVLERFHAATQALDQSSDASSVIEPAPVQFPTKDIKESERKWEAKESKVKQKPVINPSGGDLRSEGTGIEPLSSIETLRVELTAMVKQWRAHALFLLRGFVEDEEESEAGSSQGRRQRSNSSLGLRRRSSLGSVGRHSRSSSTSSDGSTQGSRAPGVPYPAPVFRNFRNDSMETIDAVQHMQRLTLGKNRKRRRKTEDSPTSPTGLGLSMRRPTSPDEEHDEEDEEEDTAEAVQQHMEAIVDVEDWVWDFLRQVSEAPPDPTVLSGAISAHQARHAGRLTVLQCVSELIEEGPVATEHVLQVLLPLVWRHLSLQPVCDLLRPSKLAQLQPSFDDFEEEEVHLHLLEALVRVLSEMQLKLEAKANEVISLRLAREAMLGGSGDEDEDDDDEELMTEGSSKSNRSDLTGRPEPDLEEKKAVEETVRSVEARLRLVLQLLVPDLSGPADAVRVLRAQIPQGLLRFASSTRLAAVFPELAELVWPAFLGLVVSCLELSSSSSSPVSSAISEIRALLVPLNQELYAEVFRGLHTLANSDIEGKTSVPCAKMILAPLHVSGPANSLLTALSGAERQLVHPLPEGLVLDVRDTIQHKWIIGAVLAVKTDSVLITYHGWDPKWDEWIPTNAGRLAPFLTHCSLEEAEGRPRSAAFALDLTDAIALYKASQANEEYGDGAGDTASISAQARLKRRYASATAAAKLQHGAETLNAAVCRSTELLRLLTRSSLCPAPTLHYLLTLLADGSGRFPAALKAQVAALLASHLPQHEPSSLFSSVVATSSPSSSPSTSPRSPSFSSSSSSSSFSAASSSSSVSFTSPPLSLPQLLPQSWARRKNQNSGQICRTLLSAVGSFLLASDPVFKLALQAKSNSFSAPSTPSKTSEGGRSGRRGSTVQEIGSRAWVQQSWSVPEDEAQALASARNSLVSSLRRLLTPSDASSSSWTLPLAGAMEEALNKRIKEHDEKQDEQERDEEDLCLLVGSLDVLGAFPPSLDVGALVRVLIAPYASHPGKIQAILPAVHAHDSSSSSGSSPYSTVGVAVGAAPRPAGVEHLGARLDEEEVWYQVQMRRLVNGPAEEVLVSHRQLVAIHPVPPPLPKHLLQQQTKSGEGAQSEDDSPMSFFSSSPPSLSSPSSLSSWFPRVWRALLLCLASDEPGSTTVKSSASPSASVNVSEVARVTLTTGLDGAVVRCVTDYLRRLPALALAYPSLLSSLLSRLPDLPLPQVARGYPGGGGGPDSSGSDMGLALAVSQCKRLLAPGGTSLQRQLALLKPPPHFARLLQVTKLKLLQSGGGGSSAPAGTAGARGGARRVGQDDDEEEEDDEDDEDEEMMPRPLILDYVDRIMEVGFDKPLAQAALIHSRGSLDAAVMWCMEHAAPGIPDLNSHWERFLEQQKSLKNVRKYERQQTRFARRAHSSSGAASSKAGNQHEDRTHVGAWAASADSDGPNESIARTARAAASATFSKSQPLLPPALLLGRSVLLSSGMQNALSHHLPAIALPLQRRGQDVVASPHSMARTSSGSGSSASYAVAPPASLAVAAASSSTELWGTIVALGPPARQAKPSPQDSTTSPAVSPPAASPAGVSISSLLRKKKKKKKTLKKATAGDDDDYPAAVLVKISPPRDVTQPSLMVWTPLSELTVVPPAPSARARLLYKSISSAYSETSQLMADDTDVPKSQPYSAAVVISALQLAQQALSGELAGTVRRLVLQLGVGAELDPGSGPVRFISPPLPLPPDAFASVLDCLPALSAWGWAGIHSGDVMDCNGRIVEPELALRANLTARLLQLMFPQKDHEQAAAISQSLSSTSSATSSPTSSLASASSAKEEESKEIDERAATMRKVLFEDVIPKVCNTLAAALATPASSQKLTKQTTTAWIGWFDDKTQRIQCDAGWPALSASPSSSPCSRGSTLILSLRPVAWRATGNKRRVLWFFADPERTQLLGTMAWPHLSPPLRVTNPAFVWDSLGVNTEAGGGYTGSFGDDGKAPPPAIASLLSVTQSGCETLHQLVMLADLLLAMRLVPLRASVVDASSAYSGFSEPASSPESAAAPSVQRAQVETLELDQAMWKVCRTLFLAVQATYCPRQSPSAVGKSKSDEKQEQLDAGAWASAMLSVTDVSEPRLLALRCLSRILLFWSGLLSCALDGKASDRPAESSVSSSASVTFLAGTWNSKRQPNASWRRCVERVTAAVQLEAKKQGIAELVLTSNGNEPSKQLGINHASLYFQGLVEFLVALRLFETSLPAPPSSSLTAGTVSPTQRSSQRTENNLMQVMPQEAEQEEELQWYQFSEEALGPLHGPQPWPPTQPLRSPGKAVGDWPLVSRIVGLLQRAVQRRQRQTRPLHALNKSDQPMEISQEDGAGVALSTSLSTAAAPEEDEEQAQESQEVLLPLLDISLHAPWRFLFGGWNGWNPWHQRLHAPAALLVPSLRARARLLDACLQATETKERAVPDILFRLPLHHASSEVAAGGSVNQVAGGGGDSEGVAPHIALLEQVNMQLSSIAPRDLRGKAGEWSWKAAFAGSLSATEGFAGPFRESLSALSTSLGLAAQSSRALSIDSIFLLSTNGRHQVGLDQDKIVLNPLLISASGLQRCFFLGQLMGCAVRSTTCLALNVAPVFWQLLLYGSEALFQSGPSSTLPLLEGFALPTARLVQFSQRYGSLLDQKEFSELLLYFTTSLSEESQTDLFPGGSRVRVPYAERWRLRDMATRVRLQESYLQLAVIRAGLDSVLPGFSMHSGATCTLSSLLTWQELEMRVCGRPGLDLAILRKHTKYSGCTVNSPAVQYFWQVLQDFSEADRTRFLQFAWAKSRLPHDMGREAMTLSIRSSPGFKTDKMLPKAETCFFLIELPNYSSLEITRKQLSIALLCVSMSDAR